MPHRIRLVIVSTAVPPGTSGQAKMLGRLAAGHHALDLTFVSDNDTTFPRSAEINETRIGLYFKLKRTEGPLAPVRLPRGVAKQNFLLGLQAAVARRGREIEEIAREQRADVILACSGNPFDIGGAAIAARRTGTPLAVYLFDDPVYQWPDGPYRQLARWQEGRWSKVASAVICANPRLAAEYVSRGRARPRPVIIPNPLADDTLLEQPALPQPFTRRPFQALYTGSIYEAQADALANVAKATASSAGDFQLHIYSPQSSDEIAAQGLDQPSVVINDYVGDMQIASVQQAADILILPLCFQSSIQETILSSSPGKMGEYLCAGRPILVHAPVGSYVAEFFRETGSGLVVSDNNPTAVLAAFHRLRDDASLREDLLNGAKRCTAAFSRQAASERFLKEITRLASGS